MKTSKQVIAMVVTVGLGHVLGWAGGGEEGGKNGNDGKLDGRLSLRIVWGEILQREEGEEERRSTAIRRLRFLSFTGKGMDVRRYVPPLLRVCTLDLASSPSPTSFSPQSYSS